MSELLEQLLNDATQDLLSVTGTQSLCRLTTSGSPGTSVKRAEGQWAALRALSNNHRRSRADTQETARELLGQWRNDLSRWSADPRSSWIPYCQGGVEAFEKFIELSRVRSNNEPKAAQRLN